MRKDTRNGGALSARGTCLDSRDLGEDELRPRGTMDDRLRIVEESERVLTIG